MTVTPSDPYDELRRIAKATVAFMVGLRVHTAKRFVAAFVGEVAELRVPRPVDVTQRRLECLIPRVDIGCRIEIFTGADDVGKQRGRSRR